MTCTVCHKAKVKCDNKTPCSRCFRLSRVCIPHISQQGKRIAEGGKGGKRTRTTPITKKPQNDKYPLEAAWVSHEVVEEPTNARQTKSRKDHYGLNFLVRSWITCAIRRRDFTMLSVASEMASKCDIPMDRLFKEEVGMEFLCNILLVPSPKQTITDGRLRYNELPIDMLKATNCPLHPTTTGDKRAEEDGSENVSFLGDRLIWVNHCDEGVSTFFLSPAFEQQLATLDEINATLYRDLKAAVVGAFLLEEDHHKNSRGYAHQISVHPEPGLPIRQTLIPDVHVKTKSHQVMKVKQSTCLSIVNPDRAFYFVEYITQDQSAELKQRMDSPSYSTIMDLLNQDQDWENDEYKFLLDVLETEKRK